MLRSTKDTAALLATLLKRSGQSRARVSALTIKNLATRKNLRIAFVADLFEEMTEYSWILFELETGGYGAVQAKALEAAKSVTVKRYFTEKERKELMNGTLDIEEFYNEAAPDGDEEEEGQSDEE
jgi:hypothetical protein